MFRSAFVSLDEIEQPRIKNPCHDAFNGNHETRLIKRISLFNYSVNA